MKRLMFFCFLILVIPCISITQNGWELITPRPARFEYKDMYCFSNIETVIVGDFGNIIKTTNGGLNWTHFGYIDNFYGNINSVYFIGNTGWCVCDSGVVFKSTNRGNNWTRYNNPGFASTYFSSVYFLNTTTGYVVSSANNILKTTNGGINWFFLSNVTNYGNVISPFFINENVGWVITWNMSGPYSNGNLYKTTNGGLNWTHQYYAYKLAKVKFFDENTGYATGGNGSPSYFRGFFLKTTNGGTNWNKQFIDSVSGFFDMDFINQNTGWVSGSNVMYKTTNAGNNWSSSNFVSWYFKAADANNLWGTKQYEIFKTSNNGLLWDTVSYNLVPLSETINNINFINENTGWGTLFFDVIKTTDGGFNWKTYPVPNARNISDIMFINDNTGWVTAYDKLTDSVYLYKSTNGGVNWVYANPTNKIASLKKLKFFAPTYIVLDGYINRPFVTKEAILRSTNSGVSWTIDSLDAAYNITICDFNNMWASKQDKLLKTTNGGGSWQQVSVPNLIGFYTSYFLNQNTGFVINNKASNEKTNYIHRTFNGGINWDSIYVGSNLALIFKIYNYNNILWAVGRDDNGYPIITKITNNFSNWNSYRPSGNRMWSDFYSVSFVNSNTGWVSGGWTEVYKTTNGGNVFVNNISNEIPDSYCLFQNFPNPFNPSTTIRFQIKENNYVTLKIYDILGKEMQTLVSEKYSPGMYEVIWDAKEFSSGVYFYKLISDGFTETKKMLLIK